MSVGVYRALVAHVTIYLTCQLHVGLDVRGGLSSACGACDYMSYLSNACRSRCTWGSIERLWRM